jgi:Flp pilus assembly protein TadD
MHYTPWVSSVAGQSHADVAAVFGESARDFLRASDVPAERIAITGNMAWDGYRDVIALTEQRDAKRSLGLSPDLPLVVYASTLRPGSLAADYVYPDWPWQNLEATLDALQRIHGRRPLQLVLKLHPREQQPERLQRYARVAARYGFAPPILGGHADARHLFASDLVISAESTVGVEAMLVGRPALTLRLGDLYEDYLYREDDATLIVRCADEIEGSIERALFDPATQAALAARRPASVYCFNYLDDGRATERVAHLVEALLDPTEAARRLEHGAAAPLVAQMGPPQAESVGRQHLQQAQRALGDGRTGTAAVVAGKGAGYLAQPGPAHFLQGIAFYQDQRTAEALAAFERATAAEPANPDYLNGVAGALLDLGRAEAAEAAVRRALAAAPDHVDALINLGDILLRRGRAADAVAPLERAAALAPGEPQVLELLARTSPPPRWGSAPPLHRGPACGCERGPGGVARGRDR